VGVTENGTVGVAWKEFMPDVGISTVVFSQSFDRGETWTTSTTIPSGGPPGEESPAAAWRHALVTDEHGHAFAMWTREFVWPESHIAFRTNAPPRSPEPDLLQPNDRVLIRPERNPSRELPAALLYQLIEPGIVEMFIWDGQGRLVRQWPLGTVEAGEHRFEWDGRLENGESAPSGAYHWELRVRTQGGSTSRRAKAILVR
jgi:hypothetical protein